MPTIYQNFNALYGQPRQIQKITLKNGDLQVAVDFAGCETCFIKTFQNHAEGLTYITQLLRQTQKASY